MIKPLKSTMSDDIPSHDYIGDLIDQLQNAEEYIKKPETAEEKFELNKEELEQFILNSAGDLINTAVGIVKQFKNDALAGAEFKDMGALAELIKASSSAVDTLSRVVIQDKRNEGAIKSKQIELEGKKELMQGEFTAKALLSREDVVKELFSRSDENIIDVTPEEPKQ